MQHLQFNPNAGFAVSSERSIYSLIRMQHLQFDQNAAFAVYMKRSQHVLTKQSETLNSDARK